MSSEDVSNVPLLLSLLPWDHQHPHDLHPTPTQQEPGSRGGSHETLTLGHISLSQEREADGVLGNPRAGTQTPGLQAQLGASQAVSSQGVSLLTHTWRAVV